MAIGMYSVNDPYSNQKREFREADQVQVSKYKRHVSAGTVPPDSQIPYTRTGVEKYRHSSIHDEFKPGAKPVYPSWATTKTGIQREILRYQMEILRYQMGRSAGGNAQKFETCYPMPSAHIADTKTYVTTFDSLRNFK